MLRPARLVPWPLLVCAALAALAPGARGGDLIATAPRTAQLEGGAVAVELSLAWRNAWRNERNHDAAWVVLRRHDDPAGAPLRLAAAGHRTLAGKPDARIEVAEDGLGAFVSADSPHRGDVSWTLALALALAPDGGAPHEPPAVDVVALEMVFVPAGPFDLGDDAREPLALSAFHRRGDDAQPVGPYRVESEAAIEVGTRPGCLDYADGGQAIYRGDRGGPIPDSFPKGTRAFYVMKYELRQGEYAAFLNALPAGIAARRDNSGATGEEAGTNTIAREGGRFVARVPSRACNFVSWSDSCAFADWAALRPLTELEYEKACRGPARPVAGDYPWGSATRDGLERVVTKERDLELAGSDEESELDDAARARFGASYWWVMDLSGGVWERVVTAGHPIGRAFRGTHGDGRLDPATGRATNDDWPRAAADEKSADGIGFRGGAEYFGPPSLTNPNSPVAARTYGAWNGADRYKTYSARAGRTAPGAR